MLSFSLGGCRLEVGFSCFALLAFCCLFAGPSGGASFLSAAALHESAHLGTLFLFRAPPKTVRFSALGCRMVLDSGKRLAYWQNAVVSLAGPAINLLSFSAACLLGGKEGPFAAASLGLGVLHILPIEPLDGGLALHAVLSGHLDAGPAGKISFGLSLLFLLPLAVLGFLVLLRTRYNFSLPVLSVYLMLYLVLQRDFLSD